MLNVASSSKVSSPSSKLSRNEGQTTNTIKCRDGMKCKRVREGKCPFGHTLCKDGIKCRLLKIRSCGYRHPPDHFIRTAAITNEGDETKPDNNQKQRNKGMKCPDVKNGDRKFIHPSCTDGVNCKKLKQRNCQFFHPKWHSQSDYQLWDASDVVDWIVHLDRCKYGKYKQELARNMSNEEVDGSCLTIIDINDLHRLGITGFKDKKMIFESIQELIKDENKNIGKVPKKIDDELFPGLFGSDAFNLHDIEVTDINGEVLSNAFDNNEELLNSEETEKNVLIEIEQILDETELDIQIQSDKDVTNMKNILLPNHTDNAQKCPSNNGNQNNYNFCHQTSNNGTTNNQTGNRNYKSDRNGRNGNNDRNGDDEKKDDDNNSNPFCATSSFAVSLAARLDIIIIDKGKRLITCDASKSIGTSGYYRFEFGDGNHVLSTKSIIPWQYDESGIYQISVSIQGINGKQATAKQEVKLKTKKNKKKKKKGKQMRLSTSTNYDPPSSNRVDGNIRIPRKLTDNIIPSRVNVKNIDNLYSYMDKLTALQCKDNEDDIKYDIGDMKVMNYDFYDERTGDSLYCIIRRQDEASSRNFKWIGDVALYNKSELAEMNITRLPSSPRSNKVILKLMEDKDKIDRKAANELLALLQKTALNSIPIYNKQKTKGGQVKRWEITPHEFRKNCQRNINHSNFTSIIILMSYTNTITDYQYFTFIDEVGVSYVYDPAQDLLIITAFHIDKAAIMEQHLLAMPAKHHLDCKCLNSWNDDPNITHLTIGDPNQHQIEKQRLKDEVQRTKEELKYNNIAMNCMVTVANMHSMNAAPTIPPNLVAINSNVYTPTNSINNALQPRVMSTPIIQQRMLSSNHGNHGHNDWCSSHQHSNQNNENK